jgi:4-hydroxy-tetrahydrodipicolinate synthase
MAKSMMPFGDLIEWQIANGTKGIVPCGTTGESATPSHQEHHRVVELTVEVVNRRVPVIAGPAPTARQKRVTDKHAKQAEPMGRCSLPHHNKPTHEIAESVDLPQILYNIPGRTGKHVAIHGRKACGLQSIVGIKEGSGSVQQASRLRDVWR